MIVACMPAYGGDEREAILLVHSIRQYGGRFSDAVLLVLAPETSRLSFRYCEALTRLGATIVPFPLPETALSFPYAIAHKLSTLTTCQDRYLESFGYTSPYE